MHFISSLGLFAAESAVILIVILLALIGVLGVLAKTKKAAEELPKIKLENLSDSLNEQRQTLLAEIDEKTAKVEKKAIRKLKKPEKRLYVIDFDGDMKCSGVEQLREQITAAIQLARKKEDEVVIRIKSGGGLVNTYGLAASQCLRIRDAGINLTVTIDQVAASGGYLMAVSADTIIAAPFAIIGSIGVVLQLPNFNKWLKKHNVDIELLTAGEHKRTLTMLGENDPKAREKCQQELNETHTLFKDFVKRSRPQLDLEQVATGEHWYGTQALELGLVDKLQTSDDYFFEKLSTHVLYQIKCAKKKNLKERLSTQVRGFFEDLMSKL